MIETRQARYFVAVAEELHFGRAAAVLQMSQPPLSQAIAALERQLGVRLLNRTSRSVALTRAGEAFWTECRVLLADADRAERAATLAGSGRGGTLRLGAVASAFADPLPRVLERFRTARPDAAVSATEIDTHRGRDAVVSGELDVVLARQVPTDPRVESRSLRRDHLMVALPADHPQAGPTAGLDLQVLAEDDWVWLPRQISPDYHDELVAACRTQGFSPRATHLASSITSQLAMVACGLGVTLVPHSSITTLPGVTYREPRRRVELVELTAMWRRASQDQLVRAFVGATEAV